MSGDEMLERTVEQAKGIARDANDHPAVRLAARLGYAASGVVHLLIAWAALGIAWVPLQHGTADQSGALGALAAESWGSVLLWVLVIGFVGLALWQLTEAVAGWYPPGKNALAERGKAVGKAIAYLALGWTALVFARGGIADSRTQSSQATAQLIQNPLGRLLVVLAGLAVVGIGAYHVVKGWKRKFLADLVENPGDVAVAAGRFGYASKGVALVILGVLFVLAGLTADAARATGLDGALRVLAQGTAGELLLTVVALGLAAYGVYSFFRARYTRL